MRAAVITRTHSDLKKKSQTDRQTDNALSPCVVRLVSQTSEVLQQPTDYAVTSSQITAATGYVTLIGSYSSANHSQLSAPINTDHLPLAIPPPPPPPPISIPLSILF